MADDLQLRATIEAILDDRGFKSLDDALAKNRDGMHATGEAGLELKDSLSELKNEFLGFLAVGALTEFYKSSIEESARLQRSWEDLTATLDSLGAHASASLPRVKEFIEALSGRGVLEAQSVPAFTKFLGILKDVEGAEAATSLAADIAARKHMDLAQATDLVVNIVQGRMLGSLRQLGIAQVDASGKAKTHSEVMAEVIKQFGGFLEKTNDAQKALDQQAVRWETLKKTVGESFTPAYVFLLGLFDKGIKLIQFSGAQVGYLFQTMVDGAHNAAAMLAAAFNFEALKNNPKAYLAQVRTSFENFVRDQAAANAELQASWDRIWAGPATSKLEENLKGQNLLIKQAGLKDLAAEQATAKAALEQAQKLAEARAKIGEAELRSEADLLAEGSELRMRAEGKLLEFQRTADKARAQAHGASLEDLLAIDRAYDNAQRLLLQNLGKAEVEAARKESEGVFKIGVERNRNLLELDKKRRAVELAGDRQAARLELDSLNLRIDAERRFTVAWIADQRKRIEIELQFAVIEAKTDKAREAALERYVAASRALTVAIVKDKQTQSQAEANSAASSLASMSSTFGNFKALAYASTVVSTYAAAQQAFQDTLELGGPYAVPLAYAAAIAAVAAGLGRVAQISGQGFDDPVSDEAAKVGGRRWATDMVREFTTGATAGWKEAMSGMSFPSAGAGQIVPAPTVVNRSSSFAPVTTTNVNITGWVGGTRSEVAARIARDIEFVQRTRFRRGRVGG